MYAAWAGLFLIFMLLPALACGQTYRWRDEQDTVYYTNDLESIPQPYRSQAELLPSPTPRPQTTEEAIESAAKVTRIPFTPGSPILVSARINGNGPVTLILDTGADRTMVAPEALGRLGVSTVDAQRAGIKGVTGTSGADVIQVASVEVGEARVGPLPIIAHDADLTQADGLLGRDFLEHFTVTIDGTEGVVTLAPK